MTIPYGGVEEGQEENNAQSAYIRVGNTIDDNSSWRAGAYMLSGDVGNRQSLTNMMVNQKPFNFNGDSDLIIYDVRYSYKNLVANW